MWQYEKKLQYPVKIANPNPALAKVIISQLGGPDGELGAALRYLNQRYSAPCREVQAILNDIGTEVPSVALIAGITRLASTDTVITTDSTTPNKRLRFFLSFSFRYCRTLPLKFCKTDHSLRNYTLFIINASPLCLSF